MNHVSLIAPMLALTCFACGATPDDETNDFGTTQLAINEDTCSFIGPFEARSEVTGTISDWLEPPSVTSPATYGTPQCTNAFRVGVHAKNVKNDPDLHVEVAYAGPVTTPSFLGCNAMWAYAKMWKLPSEGRVSEFITSPPIAYGREVRIEGQARCSVPRVQLRVPAGELLKGGIYLVAAQAGAITSYQKVAVALKTNNFL